MTRWADTDRAELARLLPDAVVVLPVGATEQHGPHLPTGTDALLVNTVAEIAVERAGPVADRPLLLAPPVHFGASDHHFPFGGTLSLTPQTLLAVLTDLARSVVRCGGRRLVLVNGHGGNRGVCHAAAAGAAAAWRELAVAYLDYWDLVTEPGDTPVPGHAGEFETALVLAIRADLVGVRTHRTPPVLPAVADTDLHTARLWQDIDGFTDDPARADADRGRRWLDQCVTALADRLVQLARTL
jgi:creatinine amidohydrolase